MSKTRGQLESEISEAVIKFEKEYMGRGPLEAKTYIFDDMVLVRLSGVLTKAEYQLAKTGAEMNGRDQIKKMRITLLESGRHLLDAVVESITSKKVKSLHTDISTVTGERIILFTLDGSPEFLAGGEGLERP